MKRLARAALALALTTAAGGGAARAATTEDLPATGVARFALVVGNNASPNPDLPKLRYADDDAVRWTLLLQTFHADVELLTELDPESVRLYGGDAPVHRAPSRAELAAAMARLSERIRQAHAAGLRTVFYFVYAGHGDADESGDAEPYVTLADGRLGRRELEERVLAASPADTNHVIIDACRAYAFAYDRGPGGTRRPWHGSYYDGGAATRFRKTGFLLASSAGGSSHEWEEFQAGIFSHELRSGLLGGADADGDGRISYAELAAFVRVANQEIRNARYRPDVLAQAPREGDEILVSLKDATAGRVRLGAGRAGRFVLEDSLGVRWADVHPGPRQNLTLALPGAEPGQPPRQLFLQSLLSQSETRLAASGGEIHLETLPAAPLSVLRRGAMHEAFTQLFAAPFDLSALTAPIAVAEADPALLSSSSPERARLATSRRRALAWATAAGALVSAGFGSVMLIGARSLHDDNASAPGWERPGLNDTISERNLWGGVGLITGAALASLATYLFVTR